MTKIYQQIDSQSFHIGTSANEEWLLKEIGALDVDAPVYDKATEKAKWDKDSETWVIKTIEEWDLALNPPFEEVSFIPQQVTRAQGKAALIQAGIWPSVIDYMGRIEDQIERELAEVALNDTTHWQRSSPFLNQAAGALGVSQEQLDDLFLTASKIEL